jgi:membrane peptidoglycan carboxypeptidase
VIKNYPEQCRRVLGKDVADAVNSVLRGVQEPGGFGYDVGINLNQASAAKTGTSENNRSVWFIGYTPNMAAAAMLAGVNSAGHWMSLNGMTIGGQYVAQAHGSSNAGPIWGDAMKAIEGMLPNLHFHRPNPRTIQGQMVTLPTVAGDAPQKAATILRRAGFNPVIGPTVNSSYAAGTVAYTSPSEGSQVGTGSTVTIYVSNGTPVAPPPPPPSQPAPPPTQSPPPQPPSPGGGGNGNGNGNGKPTH